LQNVTNPAPTGIPPEATVAVRVSTVPDATGDTGVIPRVVLLVAASKGVQKENKTRKALTRNTRPLRP
jgi:hypothetical protein